ncbi:MAG: hypothetical protein ABL886_00955, partial [Rhodoglobus sp.]
MHFMLSGLGAAGEVAALFAAFLFTAVLFVVARGGLIVDPSARWRKTGWSILIRLAAIGVISCVVGVSLELVAFDPEIEGRHRTEETMAWTARRYGMIKSAEQHSDATKSDPTVKRASESATQMKEKRDQQVGKVAEATTGLTQATQRLASARSELRKREREEAAARTATIGASCTRDEHAVSACQAELAARRRATASARSTASARERDVAQRQTAVASLDAVANLAKTDAVTADASLKDAMVQGQATAANAEQKLLRLERFARQILESDAETVVEADQDPATAWTFIVPPPSLAKRLTYLLALHRGQPASFRGVLETPQKELKERFPFLSDQGSEDLRQLWYCFVAAAVLGLLVPLLVIAMTLNRSSELETYLRLTAQALAGDALARQSLAVEAALDERRRDDDGALLPLAALERYRP